MRWSRGSPKAAQEADERLGSRHKLEPETIKRYAEKATRREAMANAGLALRIHEDHEALARKGVADPLGVACERVAERLGVSASVIHRWYDRGKAYIKRHVDDPPEFK
jgi:hypothetical protein